MILFDKWTIQAQGGVIARQYDNLTRTLTVMGDLPAGWDWSMLVDYGDKPTNVIALSPVGGGIGATLTADMIPYAGYYRMQLRGTQGEAVRHTNIIRVYIPESLTGEGQWPDLPSEFGQIEERMQELAGQAQDSADAADTSAKAAAESAAAAQGAEESVAANAKAAQDAAQNAQKSAETAQEARQGAQAAQQAIEDLEVSSETLEPDSPASVEKTVSPEGVVTLEFGIPMGPQGPPGADAPQINDAIITDANPWSAKKIVDTLAPPFSSSGAIVTCNPVAGYPLHVVSQIMPVQEGRGDPSPDNVRPISGRDSVTVNVRGKNLVGDFEEATATIGGVTWTIENDTISAQGETGKDFSATSGKVFDIVFPLPPGSYSLSYKRTDENVKLICAFYKSDNTLLAYLNNNMSYTLTENNAYVRFYAQVAPNLVVNGTISDAQFEVGSTPTPYEPYQPGTTATLTLPETIYGGTVNAVTGVGSEEWSAPISLTGEEAWSEPGTVIPGYKNYRIVRFFPYVVDGIVSSHFLGQANTNYSEIPYDDRAMSYPNSSQLIVQVSESVAPDLDSWKSYLASQAAAGTPVQVAYKLATPEPFQATGNQALPAVAGLNTIYTDGDSVTVSGRADPNAVINNLAQRIAALEGQAINR